MSRCADGCRRRSQRVAFSVQDLTFSPERCTPYAVRRSWRERVGIEPTGATGGSSIAVLKTGRTTRPDPPPKNSYRLSAKASRLSPESYQLSVIGYRLSAVVYQRRPLAARLSPTALPPYPLHRGTLSKDLNRTAAWRNARRIPWPLITSRSRRSRLAPPAAGTRPPPWIGPVCDRRRRECTPRSSPESPPCRPERRSS